MTTGLKLVSEVLGPMFVPMCILWSAATYVGVSLLLRRLAGDDKGGDLDATKLNLLGNSAMIAGVFGNVYSIAMGLGRLSEGASAISGLIALVKTGLWSTLAGISVALLCEGLVIGALWAGRGHGHGSL